MGKEKNPIKHVQFSTDDYYNPETPKGGNNDPLKKVTSDFRSQIIGELSAIARELRDFESVGVCTAIVELEDNAIAKSHRPSSLFNKNTCPFFGDFGYGKMLVQVDEKGLSKLIEKVEIDDTKKNIKALSAVKSIYTFKPRIEKPTEKDKALIIRLFRYEDREINRLIDTHFEKTLERLNCTWQKHRSESVRLYKVENNLAVLLGMLPNVASVQSAVLSNSINIQPLSSNSISADVADISPPVPSVEYPIVGVVDSGVSSVCAPLDHWVVGRNVKIPEPFRDLSHGTFVSGIVSNSYLYNQDERFTKCQSKIVSVEVLGDGIGDIFEIVNAMYETAEANPQIKVWNLSLGGKAPVSMNEISAFALMLDEFQDKFGCLCIIAAGNYTDSVRDWPPVAKLNDCVSSPGDSVRGITVGSIAQIDGHVKNEQPSPFSRKGPVSNFIQKPDLVHFGGNVINFGGAYIPIGINSVCPNGNKRNDIGTSYATPIISSLAANLFQELGQRATPNLVKGLLIHNANMHFGAKLDDEHRPYFGWGLPSDLSSILEVNDYETTIVFDGHAQKSFEVQKLPFPIPDCLRTEDGKVRGEFFVTLVYQPELDPNKAFEYCQVDVKVGLGEIDDSGKFSSKVPPVNDAHIYETDLVKNGDKWSPVKVYAKSFPREDANKSPM